MSDVAFLPPWGAAAVALAGVLLLALTLVRFFREGRCAGSGNKVLRLCMRCLCLAALLFIGLNPTSFLPFAKQGKNRLVVLLDTSESMATRDASGASRLEAACELLRDPATQEALRGAFDLDVRLFDTECRPVSLAAIDPFAAAGSGTDIASAVTEAAAELEEPNAGILLITDGRGTAGDVIEAARYALARAVPLWPVCMGGAVERRDLSLRVPSAEILAFSSCPVEVRCELRQVGFAGRNVSVEVLSGTDVVTRKEVRADPGGSAPFSVTLTSPPEGEKRYRIRVVPEREEADRSNNERSVFVRSVGAKVRVLLAEGQPHWDTKFLVQMLRQSPYVELTAVYRFAENRTVSVVSGGGKATRHTEDLFPQSRRDFDRYDIVILGRNCEGFFSPKQGEFLADFVAQGGGLIFSRGKAYGEGFLLLSRFDPVLWDTGVLSPARFMPNPRSEVLAFSDLTGGKRQEEFFALLPALDQVQETSGIKPFSEVLAVAEGEGGGDQRYVAVAVQPYGLGHVVTVNASGLWRWTFGKQKTGAGKRAYERLWFALLRWLLQSGAFSGGRNVALRSERRLYSTEQPLSFAIRTRMIDPEAYRPVLCVEGEGRRVEVEPQAAGRGLYRAQVGPFPPGRYTVRLENNVGEPRTCTLTVEVVEELRERRNLSADPETLRRCAEISAGRVLSPSEVRKLGDIVRAWQAERQLADRKITLWDRWYVYVLIVAALACEWYARRRVGLL